MCVYNLGQRRRGALVCLVLLACAAVSPLAAQKPAAPSTDPLGRENPRSAVTGFLLACRNQDYERASQYLDLRRYSPSVRASRGPLLARDLEAILNSAASFNVLELTRNPEGDHLGSDPNREHLLSVTQNHNNSAVELERVSLKTNAPPVWLFSQDTVAAIPYLTPSAAPSAIAHYLPSFLVHKAWLETPLWKWLALVLAAAILIALGGLLDHLLRYVLQLAGRGLAKPGSIPVTSIAVGPARAMLSVAVFRAVLEVINPSAVARLYIGRTIELVLVWAISYFLSKLVQLVLAHVERVLDARRQYGSRSMLHLARRAATVTIIVLAILVILSNWGYNTTTLIAGLGVGGIAVALAAQQTIANVFGGVSLIGDQPVRIGDFGKFGDLTGTVEDIGMRSTRVRTPARTLVSVPNSSFAGLNIENYSLRDKTLFTTTLPVKRNTPEAQIQQLMEAIQGKLQGHEAVEPGQSMARVTGLTATAVNLEIFCYLRTIDRQQFYHLQSEFLLLINEALNTAGVELA